MKDKTELRSTIYRDGVVSRMPNKRISVIDVDSGGAEITFWIVDGSSENRSRVKKLRNKGAVMAFRLSDAGIEALHHTINEWLRTRLTRKYASKL